MITNQMTRVAFSSVLLLCASTLFAAQSVQLQLDQPTKTDRVALPVSGGLPFAKGKLANAENLRLLDGAGKEIPLQARTLSLWPDGSVKAAVLDFQTDIPADKDASATLEYGAGVKAAPRAKGIQVKAGADKVTLDTGAAVFTFSKSGCGWMDEVTVAGKSVGKGLHFARFKGDAAPNKAVVTDIAVEDGKDIPNPLHAVVKVQGYYEGHLKTPFVLRVHAYAGKPFVRVFHTFVYAGDRQKLDDHMTELEIGIELAGGAKRILYGINGREAFEAKAVGDAALLYSKDDLNCTMTGMSEKPAPQVEMPAGWWMNSKGKPAGWMAVSGDAGSVQMGVRDMWQNYPKGLRVEGNKATLSLWPKEHAPFDLKTNARFFESKGDGGVWNDSTPALESGGVSGTHSSNGKGSAKTHELFFHFQPPAASEALTASFNAFQEPSYIFAGAKWYADTRIFDAFNPAGMDYQDPNLKKLDAAMELSARWILFMPQYWRWYGMWDYGDFVFCGPTIPNPKHPEPRFPVGPRPPVEHGRFDVDAKFKQNWAANCHYDIIQGLLLHYMRTGKREYFRQAEVSALHTNEVDGLYPVGQNEGLQAAPGGNAAAPDEDAEAAGEGGKNLYGYVSRHGCGHGQVGASHAFLGFRVPLYYLTGNERLREAMGLAFESASKNAPSQMFTSNTVRPCSAVTKVFETWWSMTGEKKAQETTKFILDYWVSRQQTKGDFGAYVGINKTYGRVKGGSNEVFDPYNTLPKDKHEVLDPNTWESGKTGGWRFMNFGATEAMMDWYNLTGDEKVGQSVVRFIRATKIHDTPYRWYKAQQHLAFAWRLTKDEAFRDWLRESLAWSRWGDLSKPATTITLKDGMAWEDFNREFTKFYKKGGFGHMNVEDCAARILLIPSALYTFEPYDKAFPAALSTGKAGAAKGNGQEQRKVVEPEAGEPK